ncbi:MAG: phytoene dehydrogenase [Deltaproteobacteria bacterium]|nr:phytoene dehydrogenase [Deltaproteobacteria bacterium]
MPLRYFDVVVLGMRPGALASAALLARRDFRVLVVGDAHLPATYRFHAVPLRRRTFAHLAATAPSYRRVLAELAQSQAFRRRLRPLDPMFQVLDRGMRLDVPPDADLLARELDRELPGTRGAIEELYEWLGRLNAAIDAVFEQDAVWPPGTFWERRETGRLRDALPEVPPALPVDPEYRRVIELGARFASHLSSDEPLPPLSIARLHAAWTRAPLELPGDEDELVAQLVDRIRAHGGEVRPTERCEAILHQRGRVRGVILDSDGEETGCGFVITDRPAARMLDRVRDFSLDRYTPHPASEVARRRFVVSLVVGNQLVPAPLSRHAFLRPLREGGVDVHLQRATFAGTGDVELAAHDAELWVCETILDEGAMPAFDGDLRAREAVLATVRDHMPLVDRHILLIDSPHDGAPPFARLDRGDLRAYPRSTLRPGGGSVDAEPAEPLYRKAPDAYATIGGEPIRTAVDRMLTVAPTVLPALGVEGELLAAWGAARLITKTDRKRERMRREMWSKIEI